MTIPTFSPPVAPSSGTSFKPTLKILEADFGDGYSQPTPDGVNHIRRSVELKWDALTLDQRDQIEGFLTARRGVEAFYFKPTGYAAPAKWTCKEWQSSITDGIWTLQATFVQSF